MQAAKMCVCSLVALFSLGCSDKPSNHVMEQQLLQQFAREGFGEETAMIENFEKVNGFEKSSNTYIADVKFDIVFQKSLKEIAQQMKEEAGNSPLAGMGSGLSVMVLQMNFGDFEAGHRIASKETKLTFLRTEKGWRIDQEAMNKKR